MNKKLIFIIFLSVVGIWLGNISAKIYKIPKPQQINIASLEEKVRVKYIYKPSGEKSCISDDIKSSMTVYGLDTIDQASWEKMIVGIKTDYLEEFENNLGFNYFQLLSRTGDIINAKTYLARTRADINKEDRTGMTPVKYAARYQNLDTLKFLYNSGADIMPKGNRYDVLNYAIKQRNLENTPKIIRFLLENGYSFFDGNKYIKDALYIHQNIPNNIKEKYIMDEFIPKIMENVNLYKPMESFERRLAINSIILSDKTGTAINYLFKKGIDLANEGEYPILTTAVLNPLVSTSQIKQLIESGFDVNKAYQNGNTTPLATAIFKKRYDVAEILLKNGAKSNELVERILERNTMTRMEQKKFNALLEKYSNREIK